MLMIPRRLVAQALSVLTILVPFGAAFAAEAAADLFPFVISYDAPDNATNMSHLLVAPAGRNGFIRVENGRFVDDAGPVRLNATNLTGPANFPTHEQADRVAARLARFGLNCVRLHYMDADYGNFRNEKQHGIVAETPETRRKLDAEQVDRLDYLIAAFKKRGIYVNVNLHVARQLDERDGLPDGRRPWADKGVDNFYPRLIALQKEYARELLAHTNPYTGLAYASDPCVAMVEINNENALMRHYVSGEMDRLPDPYAAEFRRQWNDWLRNRYVSTTDMVEAWKWRRQPLGEEMIPEGTFGQPFELDGKTWILSTGEAEATATVRDGVLRIEVAKDGNEYFPKLFRGLAVEQDEPYTLSFRIRRVEGQGTVKLGLAVADTAGGWRSLGLHRTVTVGGKWQTVSCSLSAAADSEHAQLQLTRFKKGAYEVDDLSFRPGADTEFDASRSIEEGTVPTIKTAAYATAQARLDFYQFLIDTERAYWVGMSRFLKEDLGVRSIRNQSMVNSMSCIRGLAGQRVAGKPFTVSEYNHPFPNQYGAEGQPMLRAYGRLQGWDGVFQYTYNHRTDFEPDRMRYFFSMVARTDVLAHMPACAAIYLRGDVREATEAVVGPVAYGEYLRQLAGSKAIAANAWRGGLDSRLALVHRTAVDLTGTAPAPHASLPEGAGILTSDTGELVWNTETPGKAYFVVNTPNTKLFTGFPDGRTIGLGDVSASFGETRLGWATLSLVSRQATGFGEGERPANLLLAVTGLAGNRGMELEPVGGSQVHADDWGGPMCVEGVPVTVSLPVAASRVRCYALDERGDMNKDVPVIAAGDGRCRLELGPDYRTIWYEIDIR
jgi:hypothetical protein